MNRPKIPPIRNIEAIGFADAYAKLVKTCMNEGALKRRFYGKPVNTYDMISLTEIKHPFLEPMLHPDFPTKELHCAEYEKQWERDYDWIKQGFEYNYMDRLIKYPQAYFTDFGVNGIRPDERNDYYHKSTNTDHSLFIDQLKVIRENIASRIERGGECLVSNRDQVITWIPDRDMFVSEDQPCLQRIQFFVYEYPRDKEYGDKYAGYSTGEVDKGYYKGKAEFHVTWRSRDLFGAWNSNMVALTKMLNKEIFEPNNLELIRVIDFCNSLHIYEGDWESAKNVKQVALNPQLR